VAALTILTSNEPSELSLQQHLELAPDLAAYTNLSAEGEPESLMMAQPVPHQPTDRKRVKVYELRDCTSLMPMSPSLRTNIMLTDMPCSLTMVAKIRASLSNQKIIPIVSY
jgi:3-polyprenyl-4-hydroxybenzoate decarboxylase